MAYEPRSPVQMQTAFPPLEPSELAREAERFEFNPLIPLKNYVGALDTLYREVRWQGYAMRCAWRISHMHHL